MVAVFLAGSLLAQTWTGDVLGSHNLGPGSPSPIKGGSSGACLYCHAPHSGLGGRTPLWSQTLSSQSYTLYSSTTIQNTLTQPQVQAASSLCLSCHDGTVAVGTKVPGGAITMTGSMNTKDVFGTELQSSHPFSLKQPLTDSPNLVDTLASSGTTADPLHKVALIKGTVECTSCHEPHQQNLDPVSFKFLVRDSINGQMCLACHTSSARTVGGKNNRLAQWSSSIHATSGNTVNAAANLGSYTTVAQFACLSCHRPHNAYGAAGLLRAPDSPATGVDSYTQTCMICHNGANLQTPILNVYSEFAKKSHPLPSGSNLHDSNEPAVMTEKWHATCADCHNPHSSFQVASFGAAPTIRTSQTGVIGLSASDGTTKIDPAANQYETCFRCHGTSPTRTVSDIYGYLPFRVVGAGNRQNVIPEFASSATSSHPVTHPRSSGLSQPSLRPEGMLNLDGVTPSGRSLAAGSSLFCTDCHNADDNREFGGGGPNGPHGSQYSHLLERPYEYSMVGPAALPGTPIANLNPTPDLSAGGATPGPYALCGKCHNLNTLMLDGSFNKHSKHVSVVGVSCSVCHTAHGMGSVSPSISGERLVNFDVNVVAAYVGPPPDSTTYPISYNRGTNTCVLSCHLYDHKPDGSVALKSAVRSPIIKTLK
jgi:predicted CXXCH cytochrome family protein